MLSAIKIARRKSRFSASTFFFLSGIITATWSSRIPDIQQKLHLNNAEWGTVLSALPFGLFFGLPLSTWLITKFGPVKMAAISLILNAFILLLTSIETNVIAMVVTLFCFGAVRNLVTLSGNTFALSVQKIYRHPIIAGFHGIWSSACFVAAGIGTFMIGKGINPLVHFGIITGIITIAVVIFRVKRRQPVTSTVKRPFFVRPDRFLFFLGLIVFCSMLCEGTVFDWSVNYFEKVVKADRSMVTYGYTAFIVSMALGRLFGDKAIALVGPVNLLIANGVLIALGFCLAALFPYLWAATSGFLLVGIGDAIVVPMIYSIAGRSPKMPPAYAIASVTFIGYLGFISGPFIVGFVSQHFGMKMALLLIAAICLSITIITFYMRKTRLL